MKLIAELQRRNVIRMAGLYLVGAWLLVQVAGTVLPWFSVSESILRGLVVVLVIGFVPALAFAWIFEMTPDGLKRDAEVSPAESIAPQTARRMDRIIIAALVLALVYFGFDKFVLAPRRAAAPAADVSQSPPPKAASTVPASDRKSIAVLAFTNMSADRDNEYFSDGIAEEILNSLAKVKDLKVAGRTSSFYYKGKNQDLRAIGKALGVAHVLEGSVRKQGDKVRVTAQLIRSEDGIHLWSETYDGDLKDVFALQESIARAITDELKVVLQGKQAARLVDTGTENPEAYALYLQATSIFNRRDGDHFPEAIAALEAATRLDPDYARAYARLASLYTVLSSYTDAGSGDSHAKVLEYARKASTLDPTLAEPHAALGLDYGEFRGKLVEQFKEMERALELEPDDVTTNFWYALALVKAGYTKRGTEQLERALSLDPMLPNALRWRGTLYIHAGDMVRAEQVTRRARDLGMQTSDGNLSKIAGAKGDRGAAVTLWVNGTKATMRGWSDQDRKLIAEGIYGDAAARQRAVELLDAYLARPQSHVSQMVPEALLKLQQPARALEVMQTQQLTDSGEPFTLLWSPQGRAMRALPGFTAFARDFGFFAAWDEYGPPDMCRKLGPGDYACD